MTVAALLADLLAPVRGGDPAGTPAKAANAANREHSRGHGGDAEAANALRISAKAAPDSQVFAGTSQALNRPEREYCRGVSQRSQDSQHGRRAPTIGPAELAEVAWTDHDIARFLHLRARLLRWAWPEAEAEAVAERIVNARRGNDDRVSCAACAHFRPGRCGNHRGAGLTSADIGRELATTLQRCPGFQPTR